MQLKVICNKALDWADTAVDVVNIPWSLETYASQIASFDIGIMPLGDSEWEKGKCGFKLIQYMGLGVPVVASPVGVNCTIVNSGENGFVANDISQWIFSLEALITDSDLRHQLGANGLKKATLEYNIARSSQYVVKLYSMLLTTGDELGLYYNNVQPKPMSDPLVSIGIAFYNDEKTILDAVRSVFCQTYQNWELILIDDGSTDNSLSLVRALEDNRIRIFSDGKNAGHGARLNQIAEHAQGSVIFRMDADDLMDPQRIAIQVDYLLTHSEIKVVSAEAYAMDEQCEVYGKRADGRVMLKPYFVFSRSMLFHASVAFVTEWARANQYDSNFNRAEDYELWCRTFQQGVFAKIDKPLYFYREACNYESKSYYRKYAKSCSSSRKAILHYGHLHLHRFQVWWLLFLSHSKQAIYYLMTSLNKHDFLIKQRSQEISERERKKAEQIVAEVLSTSLPITKKE